MLRLHLTALGMAAVLTTSTGAAQELPAAAAEAARARLQFLEGRFRETKSDAATTEVRSRRILGDKYVELEGVDRVAFRITIGFDSTSQRYRLSLLDAGSGAFDVYTGDFTPAGALVLQNDHFWRISLAPTSTGFEWLYEGSKDHGATWRGAPAREFRRTHLGEHE